MPDALGTDAPGTLEAQLWLIDKPAGVTSHDVVDQVRRALRDDTAEKLKVGHAGTLDPFATGLLIILIGPAVKLSQHFTQSVKKYEDIIQFGVKTDTGDKTGQVVEVKKDVAVPAIENIEKVLAGLKGKIVQAVPMYSAAKVSGRKLYEYARAKNDPPWRPLRVCNIEEIKLLDYNAKKKQLRINVVCGAGTYIRALAETIAEHLDTVGHLTKLRRLQSGEWKIIDSVKLKS